jgi:hypothetical protein
MLLPILAIVSDTNASQIVTVVLNPESLDDIIW